MKIRVEPFILNEWTSFDWPDEEEKIVDNIELEVDLSEELIEKILFASNLAYVEKLAEACLYDFSVPWEKLMVGGNPAKVDGVKLNVGKGWFWWSCYLEGTDIQIQTYSLPVTCLLGESYA